MTTPAARSWLATILLTSACAPDLGVGDGAAIHCREQLDCPPDFRCATSLQRCIPLGGDETPPEVTAITVTPPFASRAPGYEVVSISFTMSETVATSAPNLEVRLDETLLTDCRAEALRYSCTYAVGPDDSEGAKLISITAIDSTGNLGSGRATALFDFTAPTALFAQVTYLPPPTSPLGVVDRASVGAVVSLTAVVDEPLQLDPEPTLVANHTNLDESLTFSAVPGTLTATGGTFIATPSLDHADGTYTPTLTVTDLAGNSADLGLDAAVEVKTSVPAAAIDQALVTYLRSPWGAATPTPLGAFTLPAGPTFALAPADTLSDDTSLSPETFRQRDLDPVSGLEITSTPRLVRLWGDSARQTLLATLPGVEGAPWPRAALPLDTQSVWLSVVDGAGNESVNAAPIENVEIVATANRPASQPRRNRFEVLERAWPQLMSRPREGDSLGGSEAADGTVARVEAIPRWDRANLVTQTSMSLGPTVDVPTRGVVVAAGHEEVVWEWDGVAWAELRPEGDRPTVREGHALAYDSRRDVVWLFGGKNDAGLNNELWSWDGVSWTQAPTSPQGPAPRWQHHLAYDSVRDALLVYGGLDGDPGQPLAELWVRSSGTWSLAPANNAPPADPTTRLLFDSVRGLGILLRSDGEAWSWNGEAFSPLPALPDAPLVVGAFSHPTLGGGGVIAIDRLSVSARAHRLWNGTEWQNLGTFGPINTLMYISSVDRLGLVSQGGVAYWVNGNLLSALSGPPAVRPTDFCLAASPEHIYRVGGLIAGGVPSDAVARWDGFTWQLLGDAGVEPAGLSGCVYDAAGERIVRSGGWHTSLLGGDVTVDGIWERDLADFATWGDIAEPGDPSLGALPAFVSTGSTLLFFGGMIDGAGTPNFYNDLWIVTGDDWVLQPYTTPWPTARAGGAAAWDPGRGVLMMIGGWASALGTPIEEHWEWTLNGGWTSVDAPEPRPPFQQYMDLVYDPRLERTVLITGTSEGLESWQWDGATWQEGEPLVVNDANLSSIRRNNAASWDFTRERVMVTTSAYDTWLRDAAPERQPAAQLTADLRGFVDADRPITGVRLRAWCGGVFHPYDATSEGATLLAWRNGGQGARPGAWVEVGQSNGLSDTADLSSDILDWSTTDSATAATFVLEGPRAAVQCRPKGQAGAGRSRLATDFMEIRIRYRVQ